MLLARTCAEYWLARDWLIPGGVPKVPNPPFCDAVAEEGLPNGGLPNGVMMLPASKQMAIPSDPGLASDGLAKAALVTGCMTLQTG